MDPLTDIYEKLGVFYLGKEYDLGTKQRTGEFLLYDSKDLVTHAVIVGMTGSGKTGLGVGLLEEAAIDGIPALIVDPKGDLSNLLLQFPELRPSDFEPWVNADDARRAGLAPPELAAKEAQKWQDGLKQWHQGGERIHRLADAVEYTIYTPGSDAGVPISIVSSFDAPPESVRVDGDLMRERSSSMATSLLALLGISADPLRSREHILLTTLFDQSWAQGKGLDLGSLIQLVQNPPFRQVGVMDLESFFPAKERFALAMSLNNLMASPSFAAWTRGVPLDIDELLYTPAGKPRHAIFSIAHLSDNERMFFMSLLLNQTIGWMRGRPGTTSLRALLYIDEIFGYMPPVAEPPSKKPLLTLLKQARAFGVGVVLATQNPVDLDYKGLANTGTWFIGRLQTERDKERVLAGLEGASSQGGEVFDRAGASEVLSNLGKRVFLMHNVHESHPVVFETRWTLSYLTGPMTRTQIKQVSEVRRAATAAGSDPGSGSAARSEPGSIFANTPGAASASGAVPSFPNFNVTLGSPAGASTTGTADGLQATRPALPPEIPQVFLPPQGAFFATELVYSPQLLALAKVHFVDQRKGLSADNSLLVALPVDENSLALDWSQSRVLDLEESDLRREPQEPSRYHRLPAVLAQSKKVNDSAKQLAEYLYRSQRHLVYRCDLLGAFSEPGEDERDFRIRLADRAREERDLRVAKMRQKYATKLTSLQERVRKAEQTVDRQQQQADSSKLETAITFGATVLGALLGRKKLTTTSLGRATTTARGYGKMTRQSEEVRRAQDTLEAHRQQLEELETQLAEETQAISDQLEPMTLPVESIELAPRKTDVDVRWVAVAWVPTAG